MPAQLKTQRQVLQPQLAAENRENGANPLRAQRCEGDCLEVSHWQMPGRFQGKMNLSQKTGLPPNTIRNLVKLRQISRRRGIPMETSDSHTTHAFSDSERAGLYKSIYLRRDVRGQFKPDPIPDQILARILQAAHHAPSVGFMQPWNFLLIDTPKIKQQVYDLFVQANTEAAEQFSPEQRDTYRSLKLEGILESPLNICITCDRDRAGPVVIGRTHDKAMDLYSSVCAVQNLWLAARAEGIGVGWVSIFNKKKLKETLGLPRSVTPIAYLCLGFVDFFHDQPELESAGWRPRLPIEELIYHNQWGMRDELQQARLTPHFNTHSVQAEAS